MIKISALLRKRIVALFFVSILILLSRAILLYPSIVLGQIIDLIGNNTLALIAQKIIIVMLLAFAIVILLPISSLCTTMFIQNVIKEFSVLITEILFRKKYEFFQYANTGEVASKIERGIISYETFLESFFSHAIPAGMTIAIISLYFFFTAGMPMISVVGIGCFIFITLSMLLIKIRNPIIAEVNKTEDELAKFTVASIHAGKTIKAFGAISAILGMFSNLYKKYAHKAVKISFVSNVILYIQEMLTLLTSIVLIYIGIAVVTTEKSFTSGQFVIFFTYAGIVLSNLKQIMSTYKEYQEFKVDQSELAKLCQLRAYRTYTIDTPITAYTISVKPFVVLKEGKTLVSIKRELQIPHKSVMCIRGKTGKGKTTFLEIIAGIIHKPETVYIDGQDLNNISEDSMAKIFCYSPQTPQFLTGTLKTSVFFGSSYDHKKILSLMKALSLDAFVPLVDDDAPIPIKTLSGGEKKRFALVRTLASDSKIIVLDEPTSELDEKTKTNVWKTIETHTSNKTLIFSTHDSNKIACMQEIVL